MNRISVLSAFLLLFSCFEVLSQKDSVIEGISIERIKRYENFIKEEIDNGKIPGAVTLIMRNGVVVHEKAYGYSNIELKSPMKTDAIFSVLSMTKTVISVAIMMLYEEGKFQLNDPVSMYIPEFKDLRVIRNPEDGRNGETNDMDSEITILNLLTHTSGFAGYGPDGTSLAADYQAVRRNLNSHSNIASVVDDYLQLPLMSQPGQKWLYSIAHDFLSVLVEKFSGMSTRDFLVERIFKPLNMNETDYIVSNDLQPRVAQVYTYASEDSLTFFQHNPPYTDHTIWQGKSGLFSTVPDFKNFCQMLLNGGQLNGVNILSRKTVEIMTINQIEDLFPWPGYGFGLGFAVLDDLAATKRLGSEGIFFWSGAYNTHMAIDPKENLVTLLFIQRRPYDRNYHHKMLQMVYQAIVD